VIDEADTMFDQGFGEEVTRVLTACKARAPPAQVKGCCCWSQACWPLLQHDCCPAVLQGGGRALIIAELIRENLLSSCRC